MVKATKVRIDFENGLHWDATGENATEVAKNLSSMDSMTFLGKLHNADGNAVVYMGDGQWSEHKTA